MAIPALPAAGGFSFSNPSTAIAGPFTQNVAGGVTFAPKTDLKSVGLAAAAGVAIALFVLKPKGKKRGASRRN